MSNNSMRKPKYRNVAADGDLLDEVYSIRYHAYQEKGFIEPNLASRFEDEYDSMQNCRSYLTYYEDEAVGSIRSCIFRPNSTFAVVPAMEIYYEEIASAIGFEDTFVESNKFVVRNDFQRKNSPRLLFNLFQNIIVSAQENNAKYIITAVRAEHISFYNGIYFEVISAVKPYPQLSFKTVLMLCEDTQRLAQKVIGIVDR